MIKNSKKTLEIFAHSSDIEKSDFVVVNLLKKKVTNEMLH